MAGLNVFGSTSGAQSWGLVAFRLWPGGGEFPSSSSFPLSPLFIILSFLLLALRAFLFLLQDLLVPADVILLGLGGGAFVFAGVAQTCGSLHVCDRTTLG